MDYISAFWFVSFFAFFPELKTVPWLNVWVIYAYVYALISAQFPFYLDDITIPLRVTMENWCNNFLAWLLLFVLFMKSNISNRTIKRILEVFGFVALTLSVLSVPFNEQFVSGIVPNKAMNAIMLVTLLPFVANGKYAKIIICLTGVLVLHSLSSSALLAFLSLSLCYLVLEKKLSLKYLLGILGVVVVAGIINRGILDGTTRFTAYRFFFGLMYPTNYLFGVGPSSYLPINTYIQQKTRFHMETGLDLYAHSDPFQYFFEFGALGFLPLLYTMGGVLKYAERRCLLAFCAFCAGSLFYYPFHFPVHLVILFLLIKMSVNNYSSLTSI